MPYRNMATVEVMGVNSPMTDTYRSFAGSDGDRINGCFACPQGQAFDPDFGLEDEDESFRPFPEGEIRQEASNVAKRYGYELDDKHVVHSLAAEVGDDELIVSNNLTYLCYVVVFLQRMGMVVSWEDTSINSRFGNFAEDLVMLPDSYYQTYHNARNRSDFRDMSYIDTCKIRLTTDIRPMRMNHSSTNDGKASMIGKRQSWIPPGWWRIRYDVFSLFQDINLGLMRDKKFAYIPESLGGYGKRIPFDNASNMERAISTFRQGTYARLLRSIVRRTSNWYDDMAEGKNPPPDELLQFVSRFTSGWHDWVKGNSIYSPVTWVNIPERVSGYRVENPHQTPAKTDVVSRLLKTGHLVPESKVMVVHEHNEFVSELTGKKNTLELRDSIASKRKEWKNNMSLFSLEAYGYIKELTLDNEGYQPLIDIETQRFLRTVDRQALWNLKVQLRKEPVYWRSVIDDLYEVGPMKVPMRIYPRYRGNLLFADQELKTNIIDTEELHQDDELVEWLEHGGSGPPPRIIVNDDNSLIQEISEREEQYFSIVTDDRKLCSDANRKTGKPIFRVAVEWYIRALYFSDNPNPWEKFLFHRTGRYWSTLVDDGSVRSFEEQYFLDGVMLRKKVRHPLDENAEERFQVKLEIEESDDYSDNPPDASPTSFLYDYRRILALKASAPVSR